MTLCDKLFMIVIDISCCLMCSHCPVFYTNRWVFTSSQETRTRYVMLYFTVCLTYTKVLTVLYVILTRKYLRLITAD